MDTEKKSKNYYFFRHQKGYCENDIIRRVMNKAENETLADQYGFICTLITEYAIPNRGTIYFNGTEETIEEQIAFDIRRNVSLVKEVWKWWTKYGGIEKVNKAEYKIKGLLELTESRTEKADYMKEYRESRENKAATADSTNANNNAVTEKSNNVTSKSNTVTIVESESKSIPTFDDVLTFVSACGYEATPTMIDDLRLIYDDTDWERITNWRGFVRKKLKEYKPENEKPRVKESNEAAGTRKKDKKIEFTSEQKELIKRGIHIPSFDEFMEVYKDEFEEELPEQEKDDFLDFWKACDWETYWINAGYDGPKYAACAFWNSKHPDE